MVSYNMSDINGKLVAPDATNFVSLPLPPQGTYKTGDKLGWLVWGLASLWQDQGALAPIQHKPDWNEWKHFWGAARRTMCVVTRTQPKLIRLAYQG